MPPKSKAAPGGQSYATGDAVWVNGGDKTDSWVQAHVAGFDPKTGFTVTIDSNKEKIQGVPDSDQSIVICELGDEDPLRQHDLLLLSELSEAMILHNLRQRYASDIVYTNIGAIVVALNPFNYKIPWYMDEMMPKYLEEGQTIQKSMPHSWAVAHNTYNEMKFSLTDIENQSILISGESGAGKTEATKIVLRYLSRISAIGTPPGVQQAAGAVLTNLMACSPILEAFGNARTVRNDNSSRFGKLMKIKFDAACVVQGAHTTKYLLEKSRIITASHNERVYHSFYLTAIGADKGDLLYTKALTEYTSLYAGKQLDNSEFGKPEDYNEVCRCMAALSIPDQDIRAVWRLAAGVVHSSCIAFKADGEGSAIAPGENGEGPLATSCALWGITDVAAVRSEYVTTALMIMGAATVKVLPPVKAMDVRDAFSKAIYDALFGLLVDKCNQRCDVQCDGKWIALLDIFGFEDFEFNSFEQLCINLANEQLQNHYNDYIFTKDMEECRKEGISTVDIKCPDNMPCLKLITEGIFPVLDEECTLGSGTDMGFYDKIVASYLGKNDFFDKKKTVRDTFIVHHYAGSVTYNVKNWLEKNRDTLKDQLKDLIRKSTIPFCAALFSEGNAAKSVTVGAYFRNQVKLLMDLINSTNPHWIRCIKPHPAKKAKMFGGKYTILQLESSGVLGTVKIRKAGYPVRWKHRRFALRYQAIAALDILIIDDPVALARHCRVVLQRAEFLEDKFAQVGKALVFMKAEMFPLLERKRLAALQSVTRLLQKTGRGMLRRVKLHHMKYAMRIQKAGRGMFGRMLAYEVYAEKNKARIIEERRKREEKRAREAEEKKKFLAAVREIIVAEANGRMKMTDAATTFWQQFFVAEREERGETQAIAMKRMEGDRKRDEERRRREQLEAFLQSIASLIKPLFGDEARLRADIEKRQPENISIIFFEERQRRNQLIFELAARKLSHNEARERAMIMVDWYDEFAECDAACTQLRHIRGLYATAAQLNQALASSRAMRKEREEARRERAELRQRSRVELLLYEGQDGVFPLSRREQEKINNSDKSTLAQLRRAGAFDDSDDEDEKDAKVFGASARGGSPSSSPRTVPPNVRLETSNDALLDKLKKISDLDRAVPIHCRAAGVGEKPSLLSHRGSSKSISMGEGAEAAAIERNPAETIRAKLDPLKRRPLRNVEVGQRVYSHRDFAHGEVLAKRPGALAVGRMSAAFQVKLDTGTLVWLELDDVSEAVGSLATIASAAASGLTYSSSSSSSSSVAPASVARSAVSSRQQQDPYSSTGRQLSSVASSSVSASYHRDPAAATSAAIASPSVAHLVRAESLHRGGAVVASSSHCGPSSRGPSPAATARRSVAPLGFVPAPYQRVAPVNPSTNTSGTMEGHHFYSNWQSRMQALERDDDW